MTEGASVHFSSFDGPFLNAILPFSVNSSEIFHYLTESRKLKENHVVSYLPHEQ